MSFGLNHKKLICSMCNRIVMKLVPLYDHDQKHKGIQCCRDCKRKMRAGIPIEKFKGKPGELNE